MESGNSLNHLNTPIKLIKINKNEVSKFIIIHLSYMYITLLHYTSILRRGEQNRKK